ncbi:MAG: LysE family transporter, partial [Nitrosarchaeum sp.]|nr:LysE family transporter [Nitrosarchaeum sp.]
MWIWAFAGRVVVFLLLIWRDFVWLYSVACLASKSAKILSNKNYKILMIGLSAMLIYFGISFMTDVI